MDFTLIKSTGFSYLERITDLIGTLLSWVRQKWLLMSTPQRIPAMIIAGAGAGIASCMVWNRLMYKRGKFNSFTTSAEAMDGIDLSGKTAIITGSNIGLGKQTALKMYEHGCNIVMACRNMEKADRARLDIVNATEASSATIETMKLDLSSLQSVRDFATAFIETNKAIDYLILNAGIMALNEFKTSTEGYELQFAVNHIGHQYLTTLLMPKLIENKSRVIALSSVAHGWCTESHYEQFLVQGIKNKDGPSKDGYNPWFNYAISKCSNILFARELHRRYGDKGITAVSCHPGAVEATGLGDHVEVDPADVVRMLTKNGVLWPSWFMHEVKTLDQGAATQLRCVSMGKDEIQGGHYYVNCQSGTDNGWLKEAGVVTTYEDYEKESKEARLWKLTELLIAQKEFSHEL